jgi:hypothetical protein
MFSVVHGAPRRFLALRAPASPAVERAAAANRAQLCAVRCNSLLAGGSLGYVGLSSGVVCVVFFYQVSFAPHG